MLSTVLFYHTGHAKTIARTHVLSKCCKEWNIFKDKITISLYYKNIVKKLSFITKFELTYIFYSNFSFWANCKFDHFPLSLSFVKLEDKKSLGNLRRNYNRNDNGSSCRYSAFVEYNRRRIADVQMSFILFSAWHNHVLGVSESVHVTESVYSPRVCASMRRNSGPLSGSQPAGLRESARLRSGFRTLLNLIPQS